MLQLRPRCDSTEDHSCFSNCGFLRNKNQKKKNNTRTKSHLLQIPVRVFYSFVSRDFESKQTNYFYKSDTNLLSRNIHINLFSNTHTHTHQSVCCCIFTLQGLFISHPILAALPLARVDQVDLPSESVHFRQSWHEVLIHKFVTAYL